MASQTETPKGKPSARKAPKGKPEIPAAVPAPAAKPDDKDIRKLADTFKLLSDSTRLGLLIREVDGDGFYVGEVAERIGLAQPAVSHHVAMLAAAGMVSGERIGKRNRYRVNREALKGVHAIFE